MSNFVVSLEHRYLFSKKIHQSYIVYDSYYFESSLFTTFQIQSEDSVNDAVVKRRSEFLAGRIAAKSILRKLGKADQQITIGENRSPNWPQGYVGSISHNEREAICLIASSKECDFIGVDIENWFTYETAISIKENIVSEAEVKLLLQSGIPFSRALTIVFSAKESLFKALYPSVGRYFGFEAAHLIDLDTQNNTFSLALVEKLEGKICAETSVFTGMFIPKLSSLVSYIW